MRIQYNLIHDMTLEGLIDRKIVPIKWQELIRPVHDAIDVAYGQLPMEAKALIPTKG
jgi:hypothetical protein